MQDNWYALVIAILFKQPPETAFQILEEGERNMNYSKLTELDTLDMIKFREEGITYREYQNQQHIKELCTIRNIKRTAPRQW